MYATAGMLSCYRESLCQCMSLIYLPLYRVSSPDPTHKTGKGLVTLLAFLGCADSAIHMCTNTFDMVLVALSQQCTRAPIPFLRELSY